MWCAAYKSNARTNSGPIRGKTPRQNRRKPSEIFDRRRKRIVVNTWRPLPGATFLAPSARRAIEVKG
jgi:hypothetical protein